MTSVYSSSACFVPGGDFEILDRLSVEVLCTCVGGQQTSCVCLVCLLLLFGVLVKEHAEDWLKMAKSLPGTAFDSSVTGDETVSEVTLFAGVLLGSLFLAFRGPPERSFIVVFPLSFDVASYPDLAEYQKHFNCLQKSESE